MTKQMTLIEDNDKLKAAIAAHGKRRNSIDQETQMLALSAVNAFLKHGNVYYINHLYANMGKGARHVALTAWFLEFGGVQANEGQGKDVTPFIKDANKVIDMEGGARMPWYDFKASPKPDETLDLYKLLMATIKKAQKPKEGQEVLNAAMLPELQALAEKYQPNDATEESAAIGE